MYRINNSGNYHQFKIFQPFSDILVHGVFSREQGNVSFEEGLDEPAVVLANRERIKKTLNLNKLISLWQTHSKNVLILDKIPENEDEIEGFDALVTNQPGVGLMIKTADCQPILLFDPRKKVVAAVHSGWKGTMQNIIKETVSQMKKKFSSDAEDILAGIGPSLGPCCAEFSRPFKEILEDYHPYIGENRVDLWGIVIKQLKNAGIKNIELAQVCTRCNNDTWFSHRGDSKEKQGRFGSVVGINL